MKPNFQLLKDAYAIIGGIPDEQFHLDSIFKRKDSVNNCGTIACAMGWLSLHPQFNQLGLRHGNLGLAIDNVYCQYDEAAKNIFSISREDARNLFGISYAGKYDRSYVSKHDPHFDNPHLDKASNHKNLFLHRVESFLKEHGEWKGFQS